MIISASYKTDIPAFYGDWFMARLEAGFCRMVNPYGGQIYEVALDRARVDGFVFWTKNLAPFLAHLAQVQSRGFPSVVQYSINGYPRLLEHSVSEVERSVAHMHDLAATLGPRAAVWRYDPVLITSLTPPRWHVENFARLAAALRGSTDEAVVSFTHIYRKTRRNLAAAVAQHGFQWRDPGREEKRALVGTLAAIAADCGMTLTLCTQPEIAGNNIAPARCIDAGRLSDVAGEVIQAQQHGNRPGCACSRSRDIGAYDSCPHGCVYCYAVSDRRRAQAQFRAHDRLAEFLVTPAALPKH